MDKIIIYPLGGISKFNLSFNDSVRKEFIILIMGPIFQIIAKNLLLLLLPNDTNLIIMYHYGILFFNLLPIYPLDGGKLLNLFFTCFLPLKRSLYFSIYFSYLLVISLFFINQNNLNINIIIMLFFLLYKIHKEKTQISYLYQKFLLERYLKKYNFKRSKLINNEQKFYRNSNHLLRLNNKYYSEIEYLEKKFKKITKSVDNEKCSML